MYNNLKDFLIFLIKEKKKHDDDFCPLCSKKQTDSYEYPYCDSSKVL